MAGVPVFDEYLLNFWDQVCDIAVDYDEVLALNAANNAKYKLINVLWDVQRDEFLTMATNAKTAADSVIDAVRGVEPRPTLTTPVRVGDQPIYPLEFERIPSYSAVTNYSYTRRAFNPSVAPGGALPDWWYIGSELYKMVLRADAYVLTPLEPVTGVTLGVWGASMWYGLIGLQLLHNGYATAKNSAQTASIQIIEILNEKSRRNR